MKGEKNMEMVMTFDPQKITAAQHKVLREIVAAGNGGFYDDGLQVFARNEAHCRVEQLIGEEPDDKGLYDELTEALHDFLTDNETAINYNEIDDISRDVVKRNGYAIDEDE